MEVPPGESGLGAAAGGAAKPGGRAEGGGGRAAGAPGGGAFDWGGGRGRAASRARPPRRARLAGAVGLRRSGERGRRRDARGCCARRRTAPFSPPVTIV